LVWEQLIITLGTHDLQRGSRLSAAWEQQIVFLLGAKAAQKTQELESG
jgi:hypothetical protein